MEKTIDSAHQNTNEPSSHHADVGIHTHSSKMNPYLTFEEQIPTDRQSKQSQNVTGEFQLMGIQTFI